MNSLKKENQHLVRLGVIGAGLVGAEHAAIADPNPAARRLTEELAVSQQLKEKEQRLRWRYHRKTYGAIGPSGHRLRLVQVASDGVSPQTVRSWFEVFGIR